MKRKFCIIVLLVASGISGFMFSLYGHSRLLVDDIQTIEVAHYPATFVKQLKGDPLAGQKIFQEFCSACHANPPIIDIPAPRIGDKKAWQRRRQMGMPVLLKVTINGIGAMPARGGCFECSDQQLQETILYMLKATP